MRIRSDLYVQAIRRLSETHGAFATIVYRGDAAGGAVYVKLRSNEDTCWLYEPEPMSFAASPIDRRLVPAFDGAERSERDVDAYVVQQRMLDTDLWMVEIEQLRSAEARAAIAAWLTSSVDTDGAP